MESVVRAEQVGWVGDVMGGGWRGEERRGEERRGEERRGK